MKHSEAGVNLLEMTIATALGSLAVLAILNLISMLMQQQYSSQSDLRAQVGVMSATRLVERDLRQTTYLIQPAMTGVPSSSLVGCVNASVPPGAATPEAVDPAQPVRGYALCVHSGVLYYHTTASCPPVYACGTNGVSVAGSTDGKSVATVEFTRSNSASSLVEGDITIVAGGETTTGRASAVASISRENSP